MRTTSAELNLRAFLLFLLAALATAGWFGLTFLLPEPAPPGIPLIVLMILFVDVVILFGLWRGLARTDLPQGTRLGVWLAVAVPFALWGAAIWVLSARGTFEPASAPSRFIPLVPLAIVLPVAAGLTFLTYSRRIASLLDAMPPSWLVGVQVYRVLGAIFLVEWARGNLTGAFALPAGIGDITVGLLALPAASWVSSGTPFGRKLGIWWNLLGLADFAVAMTMGMTTSPGRFQVFALDQPNSQIGTFPLVMIPAFAVPSAIIQHVLSLWQLRRLGRKATRGQADEQTAPRMPVAGSV